MESSPRRCDLFGFLYDDLVIDILSRIPTQQCSTVCKSWHSLLGTLWFAQEHERRPASTSVPLVHRGFEKEANNRLLFFRDEETRRKSNNVNSLFRSVHPNGETEKKMPWPLFQLRASYHGLLLFQEDSFTSAHCILNPLTREVVTFANPDQVCGLYYHPPNMQYRLLCFRKVTADTGTSGFLYYVCSPSQEFIKEVGTYDFEIDVEEVIVKEHPAGDVTTSYLGATNIPAVAADSYLYWLVYQNSIVSARYIMAFDVMNETLQFMPHPKGHPTSPESPTFQGLSLFLQHWKSRLFEIGNCLHLHVTGDLGLEVWAVEDHKTWRWAKVFALDDSEPSWNRRLPLAVEGGELLYLLPERGIFRTNSLTKRVEFIGNMETNGSLISICTVNWRKSLVSFKDYL